MKRRTAKKIAKRYLDTGIMPKKYAILVEDEWWRTDMWVTYFDVVSATLHRAICEEAYRRGWNGSWWDSPLVISIDG